MLETPINWIGKLQELGQKCRFVVSMDVAESSSYVVGSPSFTSVIKILEYNICVEETALSKKAAKTAAAKLAYGKICEKINVPHSSSIDVIMAKLKDLSIKEDSIVPVANFFKSISGLDLSSFGDGKNVTFSDFDSLVSSIDCVITYNHSELKQEDKTEFFFKCEVHPKGVIYPIISGFGLSSKDIEDAKNKAVGQLITLLKIYSSSK